MIKRLPSSLSRLPSLLALLVLLVGSAGAQSAEAPESVQQPQFEGLFDGETLNGWNNPYDWGKASVADGEIHLVGNRKFFLSTDRTFGDFVLELEVRLPEGKANSGIMFRCHREKNRVFGYQAEVDPSERSWSGGLYDEGRRGWIAPLSGESKKEQRAAFDRTGWNRYRIECQGDWIRTWVNGVLTTDEHDALDQVGHIALQHHGEAGQTYRFRNIQIKDMGHHEWKPLFDGQSLKGWKAGAGGEWSVQGKSIVGASTSDEKRHGILLSDASYGDFTARVEFRSITGNSGFYFRSDPIEGGVGVHGFQAEIEPWIEGQECLVGGLYETGGRAWVVRPAKKAVKKYYRPGEWNVMTVSAHAGRIVVHINDSKSAELFEDPGRREGRFGLQLHGGQDMHVEFRRIEVLVPGETAADAR